MSPGSPDAPFEVHVYSPETLIRLTAALSRGNTEEAISGKSHPTYLANYFHELGVSTIVVERGYIDRCHRI